MKYISYTIAFIFIVHCTVINDNCFAQWQPEMQIEPGGSTFASNNANSIVTNGNAVYFVFNGLESWGHSWIGFYRSTNNGVSWSPRIGISAYTTVSYVSPSIAVSGFFIHLVHSIQFSIQYSKSTNGGLLWLPERELPISVTGNKYNPIVATAEQIVHVFWVDTRHGNKEIYYMRSTDQGTTWGNNIRITNDTSSNSEYPSVSVSGLNINLTYQSNKGGYPDIYYKNSTNSGTTWSTEKRLTNNPDWSYYPSIGSFGELVHIVWVDYRIDFQPQLFYKRSTDNGDTWGPDIRLTFNPDTVNSFSPNLSVSGSNLHLVWQDNRHGNYEIYYKRSFDAGINWEADARITNHNHSSTKPFVSASGTNVHVLWLYGTGSLPQIYYKRNPTGNIGINVISADVPSYFSLSQNYPNPFNPSTKIRFDVPRSEFIKLVVYDFLGREVSTPVNQQLNTGTYEVDFDGSNMTSGVYFYKIFTVNYTETKKMVLLK